MARLRVEVAQALAGRQEVVRLVLPEGATAGDAAKASGLGEEGAPLGIGGRKVPHAQVLRNGDRVEFLRPLALSPGESRRRRARRRQPA